MTSQTRAASNQKKKSSRALFTVGILILLGCVTAALPGCTQKKPLEFPVDAPALAVGSSLFPMDWRDVAELEIRKEDPVSGDQWSVHLNRPSDTWEILDASVPFTLQDRRADTKFLGHLIDTLSTLRVHDFALQGPPSSFGLDHPTWILRWKLKERSHELRLGDVSNGAMRFAELPGRIDAAGKPRTLIIVGAALEMLARLDSFQAVRAQVIPTFESDDIDVIQTQSRSGKFLAERYNEGWVIPGTTKAPARDAAALLESLTHLRARRFLDDQSPPIDPEKLRATLENKSEFQAFFTERKQGLIALKAARANGTWYATLSSRPGILFELFPEAEKLFH